MFKNKKASELSLEEARSLVAQKEAEAHKRSAIGLLEEEFKKAAEEGQKLLREKVRVIDILTNEAVAISEQYGIPFELGSETYTPNSFKSKWRDLLEEDNEIPYFDVLECQPGFYSGWNNSSSRC
jgi:alanyl-tRNA synthetase